MPGKRSLPKVGEISVLPVPPGTGTTLYAGRVLLFQSVTAICFPVGSPNRQHESPLIPILLSNSDHKTRRWSVRLRAACPHLAPIVIELSSVKYRYSMIYFDR